MNKYIIIDWANNQLRSGIDGLPLEFEDFEDAWDFIYNTDQFGEDDYQDLYVIEQSEYTPN